MSRIPSAIILAGALACTVACDGGKPSADQSAQKSDPKPAAAPDQQSAPVAEVAAPSDERPPPPAWYDASKIEHAAVISNSVSKGKIAGGYASAMVLELLPGTTTEQCIEKAQAALGESLDDLPEPVTGADGRQTIQGQKDGYHYTVVCGEAKGKPTVYLSYRAQ